MAKRARLDSCSAREKLKPRGAPYWAEAGAKVDLGYRRLKAGVGSWAMRRYVEETRTYVATTFARADDLDEADGVDILNYHEAQAKARELAAAAAEEERLARLGPPLTVARAVEEYVEAREQRWESHGGAGAKGNARNRLARHVLSDRALASTPLAALTANQLAAWLAGRAHDQRTMHDFKAALNLSAKRHRDVLPPTLRDAIRDGLAGSHARARAPRDAQVGLPDADVRRVVAAAWQVDEEAGWDGGLGRLVMALAATGARMSQVVRMRVADVQLAQGRLMVPTSRKGGGAKMASHVAVRVGPDVLAALAPATAGRLGHESLFLRPHWRLAAGLAWERGEELRPWASSDSLRRPWAAVVAKAGLPSTVTPYALRHSSICRALKAGLPVQLVARLHDTSAAMIERNYSAQIVSLMDEFAERAIIPLTTPPPAPIAAVRR